MDAIHILPLFFLERALAHISLRVKHTASLGTAKQSAKAYAPTFHAIQILGPQGP
jgi:hypothetical protein